MYVYIVSKTVVDLYACIVHMILQLFELFALYYHMWVEWLACMQTRASGFWPLQPAVPMQVPTTLDGGDVESHEEVRAWIAKEMVCVAECDGRG